MLTKAFHEPGDPSAHTGTPNPMSATAAMILLGSEESYNAIIGDINSTSIMYATLVTKMTNVHAT
jgi:hypothetical protein